MPRLVGALDRRDRQRIDSEIAPQKLQHAHLLHAHFEVDRRDLEGRGIGGVVQMLGHGIARDARSPVQTAFFVQQLLAILRDLDQPVVV